VEEVKVEEQKEDSILDKVKKVLKV
jgi:hypothetical protein